MAGIKKLRDVLRPLKRSDMILTPGNRVLRIADPSVLDEVVDKDFIRGHRNAFAERLQVVIVDDNGHGQPSLNVSGNISKVLTGSGATESPAFDSFFVLTDTDFAASLPDWFYRTGDLSRRPGFMGSTPRPETMKAGGEIDDFTQPRPRRGLSKHEVFRRTLDTLFRDSDVSVQSAVHSSTDTIFTPLRNVPSLINSVKRSLGQMPGTKKTTHRGNLSFKSTDQEARIFVKAMMEAAINLGHGSLTLTQTVQVLDHFGDKVEVQIIVIEGQNTTKLIRIDYDVIA